MGIQPDKPQQAGSSASELDPHQSCRLQHREQSGSRQCTAAGWFPVCQIQAPAWSAEAGVNKPRVKHGKHLTGTRPTPLLHLFMGLVGTMVSH